MRNTPNPGRTVYPATSMPLPDEAAEESGAATPGAAPAADQVKSSPKRNEVDVGDGRPTRRWGETVDAERATGGGKRDSGM